MGRRRKVEDKAYDYIKRQITTDSWLEGRQIKEMDISVALEISRTPIRNAFLRLEKEGLVVIAPNKGVFVAGPPIDLKGVKERLYYLEVLLHHVLYTLELSETTIRNQDYADSVELMEKNLTSPSVRFEQHEKQFWQTILSHHDNKYMNESILNTLTSLVSTNDYAGEIFRNSRSVKLDHYKNLTSLIGREDYIYARREIRILLNQLLINLIQGME
ncbi:GntR family transcriptional regulator [Alkalibacterium olivapovliticus]|uniref:DNA-binding GntR family transcriptional regulator n=1 Tax=Alkalibacterium olivapovliticus TaxID=99907 RepID=A0A2T0W886_9LACT|nr:GntR family transcriptional regulator [Alkalibacterium olivapovliticus]PRY82889.1 DNA-binding GntR family transcriptional regulator [Alkalibacterium olivapovliticus]